MILPSYPPRSAWLKAFWLVISLFAGALLVSYLALAVSPGWSYLGLGASLLTAMAGLKWPKLALLPYRVWNKLARECARLASLWLITICYYIVIAAVGRAGSRFLAPRPALGESMWQPRATTAAPFRGSLHGVTVEPVNAGWGSAYLSWAGQSANAWAWFLWPFVVLIAGFGAEEEKSKVPADIYTLF